VTLQASAPRKTRGRRIVQRMKGRPIPSIVAINCCPTFAEKIFLGNRSKVDYERVESMCRSPNIELEAEEKIYSHS
jgi:hypothetical protein